MKIYVASSWRNQGQPEVVAALRADGHEVYDFRNPPNRSGFSWRQVSERPVEHWTPRDWVEALKHPIAEAGFESDMGALRACDVCVLVLPCGRSAHLELGWATGAGKRTVVLAAEQLDEPELMVKMCNLIVLTLADLRAALRPPVAVAAVPKLLKGAKGVLGFVGALLDHPSSPGLSCGCSAHREVRALEEAVAEAEGRSS